MITRSYVGGGVDAADGDGGIERPITLAHGLEDSQGGHADHADAVRGPEIGRDGGRVLGV